MLKEVIIVEGKMDTVAVKRALECDTIETGGFALRPQTLKQIEAAYKKRGIIILTDPDVTREQSEQWYRRNRFGGSVGDPVANHSFNDWIRRFAKTKPEYLALQSDGSRSGSRRRAPSASAAVLARPSAP